MRYGVTLSNRLVALGLATARDLLRLADAVEASPAFDSLWVGDALFVNPRLDALTLLAAVAARTERVLLGPACMGSFALRNPLVFAYEWASLDVLSGGRTRLVACAGGGSGPAWEAETRALGFPASERRKRMLEHVSVLRHLWTKDDAPFEGEFFRFSGVTLEPKPVQRPCPIWLATNAERLARGQADSGGSDLALARVGRFADGWMTHSVSPSGFARSWAKIAAAAADTGRPGAVADNVLYHHVAIGSDRETAFADAKRFLDLYYGADYSRERVEAWLAYGTADDCVRQLRPFRGTGLERIAFRLSTMGDPLEQLRRLEGEVLPRLEATR